MIKIGTAGTVVSEHTDTLRIRFSPFAMNRGGCLTDSFEWGPFRLVPILAIKGHHSLVCAAELIRLGAEILQAFVWTLVAVIINF